MSAQRWRLGPRSWVILGIVALVVLGGWLLGGRAADDRTSEPTPSTATSAPATATDRAPTTGTGGIDSLSGLPWVAVAELPREARHTLDLIDRDGPFPYAKDGSTFNNFEGLLPQEQRGYYREYTVETPGSPDRGARRIVTGDQDRIYYWTADHYETFQRIRR